MSDCKYCGKPAGFLKKEHAECKEKYQTGLAKMSELALNAAYSGNELTSLEDKLNQIAGDNFFPLENIREVIICGFADAVKKSIEDGVLDENEEKAVITYKDRFSLTQDELENRDHSYVKYMKAKMIREVLNGEIPKVEINVSGDFPIILQKNEKLLWIFQGVSLLENRVQTQYRGSSHGLSIKIAKGLYYRPSAFQGKPIKTETLTKIDAGLFVVTDKSLYFSGSRKKARIKYSDIMALENYSDGIGITKHTAMTRPQCFMLDDPWFAYNLILNLGKI